MLVRKRWCCRWSCLSLSCHCCIVGACVCPAFAVRGGCVHGGTRFRLRWPGWGEGRMGNEQAVRAPDDAHNVSELGLRVGSCADPWVEAVAFLDSPKSQTTSPKTAHFCHFLARWSALWACVAAPWSVTDHPRATTTWAPTCPAYQSAVSHVGRLLRTLTRCSVRGRCCPGSE